MIIKAELQFTESFNGKIWQMLKSADERFLVLEIRNEPELHVEFYSFDISSYQLEKINISDNDWWVTLEDEQDGVVRFKKYNADENPEIVNRYYFDLKSKIELADKQFSSLSETAGGQSTYYYPASSEHFQLIKEFTKSILDIEILEAGAEYFESERIVAISYYIKEQSLANYLLITDMDRNILMHELLANNISGIGQETFSIVKDNVIFARNKLELKVYSLR